jgi:hypothetical protein
VRVAAQGAQLGDGVTQEKLDALPKRLVELDGRRAGPIDHGECTDLLTVRVQDVSVRTNADLEGVGCSELR